MICDICGAKIKRRAENAVWYEVRADGRTLLVCPVCREDHLEAARREGIYLADAVRQRGKGAKECGRKRSFSDC